MITIINKTGSQKILPTSTAVIVYWYNPDYTKNVVDCSMARDTNHLMQILNPENKPDSWSGA